MVRVNISFHRVRTIKVKSSHILPNTGNYARSIRITDIDGNDFEIDLFSEIKESLGIIFKETNKELIESLESQYPLVGNKINKSE